VAMCSTRAVPPAKTLRAPSGSEYCSSERSRQKQTEDLPKLISHEDPHLEVGWSHTVVERNSGVLQSSPTDHPSIATLASVGVGHAPQPTIRGRACAKCP